jgi:hypothetical protein
LPGFGDLTPFTLGEFDGFSVGDVVAIAAVLVAAVPEVVWCIGVEWWKG